MRHSRFACLLAAAYRISTTSGDSNGAHRALRGGDHDQSMPVVQRPHNDASAQMMLRRGLCRVCFDGNIRPSELYDEMLLPKASPRPGAIASPKAGALAATVRGAKNGNGHRAVMAGANRKQP